MTKSRTGLREGGRASAAVACAYRKEGGREGGREGGVLVLFLQGMEGLQVKSSHRPRIHSFNDQVKDGVQGGREGVCCYCLRLQKGGREGGNKGYETS